MGGKTDMGVDGTSPVPEKGVGENRLKSFSDVVEGEKKAIGVGDGPTVGLALSGGGIRSAAFSLGVLQGLKAHNVFDRIDFLSTVSGGGYTGAALVAAMERNNGKFPFDAEAGDDEVSDIADSQDVRNIRDRSRYLMPDGKFDILVSLGIILKGIVSNATIVFAGLFISSAIPVFLFNFYKIINNFVVSKYEKSIIKDIFYFLSGNLSLIIIPVTLIVWLIIFASLVYFKVQSVSNLRARLTGWGILVGALIFLIQLQIPILRQAVDLYSTLAWGWMSLIVAALVVGAVVLASTWRWFVLQIQLAARDPGWIGFLRKRGSQLTLYILSLALPSLIYISWIWMVVVGVNVKNTNEYKYLYENFIFKFLSDFYTLILIIAIYFVAIVFNYIYVIYLNALYFFKLKDNFVYTLICRIMFFVVYYFLLRLFIFIYHISMEDALFGKYFQIVVFCINVGLILSTFSLSLKENSNSLHSLYKDRLRYAFSMVGKKQGKIPLSKLKESFAKEKEEEGKLRRPYPIINAAINLGGSKNNRRARNADFFIFTPCYVGSEATGYVSTEVFEKSEPDLDLAAVAAISGAAVSPAMGRIGLWMVAPTLALLNLRLAYWARNPKRLKDEKSEALAKADDWKLSYLFSEAFGRLNEDRSKVLLSDGGHIDNLGLYQLLKRRCDVIIVSDAEEDRAMNFGALVDVERLARIDLGVRLEIPWQNIRDSSISRKAALEKGNVPSVQSPQHHHAVIGTILYPKIIGKAGAVVQEERKGTILYVKSSVTGDEASYILDYERRFPQFPHEGTGDQFFSEEQFEVYRALGFHAMDRALDVKSKNEVFKNRMEPDLRV